MVDRRDGTEAERTVFFDVKCSMALEEAILASGGVPKMVRTGHSFMKRELRSNPEAVMAGEMSATSSSMIGGLDSIARYTMQLVCWK